MRNDNGYAFDVYIHERGKRPRLVGRAADPWLETWTEGDRTFFFATADLSRHTVTFTETRPAAVVVEAAVRKVS